MSIERWKPVVGYEGLYEVSDHGRVRSLSYRGAVGKIGIMVPNPKKRGYLNVSLRKNGTIKTFQIHRLVAFAFLGFPPPGKNHVNHINEVTSDNRADNLEWCSAKYNINYGHRTENLKLTQVRNGKTRCCILEKDGVYLRANSISEMARKIGTTPHAVKLVIDSKATHAKGWHIHGVKESKKNLPVCITLTDDKETISFKSLSEAALHIGCSSSNLGLLIAGKTYSCHGWHIPGVKTKKHTGHIVLTNGVDTLDFKSISEAARELGCSRVSISALISGKQESLRGWMIVK